MYRNWSSDSCEIERISNEWFVCVCAWCMLRFMDASSFVINITDHPASNFVYISRKLPLQDVDIDAAATAHTCIAMVLCCDWLWCVFRV